MLLGLTNRSKNDSRTIEELSEGQLVLNQLYNIPATVGGYLVMKLFNIPPMMMFLKMNIDDGTARFKNYSSLQLTRAFLFNK